METIMTPAVGQLIEAKDYFPAVSIIMPFETKMSLKTRLSHSLMNACDKVERVLLNNYPYDMGVLVMHKLRDIIHKLDFSTYKNSIAIYVSPVFEKVLYLDVAVEEKIMVDKSFEITDLVNSKKQLHQYLVLLLSNKGSKVYVGNFNELEMIVSNRPESFYTHVYETPGTVVDYSNNMPCKEKVADKFLLHIDNALDIILNAYHLPVYVAGPERIVNDFKNLTKHGSAVIAFVPGNYEEISFEQLKEIMQPLIADWKMVKQTYLLNQLQEAAGKNKLAVGMRNVWREAMEHKGRLLLVEKNYVHRGNEASCDEIINKAIEPYNKFSYIKDEVDDVMEKVLEAGGDVEFVAEGVLQQYQQIALVQC